MSLRYLQYDVFTDQPLSGNQLAVFLDARGLSTERMQALAREMNFSESTFILPAEAPDTGVRMRIFTPGNEMPMAGHPTIGSTFALAETGVIAPGAARFVFGLNVGPIPVDLEWKDNRLYFAWMTQLAPVFGEPIADRASVAAAIGLREDDLASGQPVQEISCGVPFLFVPVRDRETVDRAETDAAAYRRLREAGGKATPGIFLFSMLPPGAGATVHSRMFAQDLGIVEDPATGIASGPLGCYLVRHRMVDSAAADRIVSRQGVAMGRPSTIHIRIADGPDGITGVQVGGRAVLVARGEMLA